jgi:hypothetical protein
MSLTAVILLAVFGGLFFLALVIAVMVIGIYNSLVGLRNMVKSGRRSTSS